MVSRPSICDQHWYKKWNKNVINFFLLIKKLTFLTFQISIRTNKNISAIDIRGGGVHFLDQHIISGTDL